MSKHLWVRKIYEYRLANLLNMLTKEEWLAHKIIIIKNDNKLITHKMDLINSSNLQLYSRDDIITNIYVYACLSISGKEFNITFIHTKYIS